MMRVPAPQLDRLALAQQRELDDLFPAARPARLQVGGQWTDYIWDRENLAGFARRAAAYRHSENIEQPPGRVLMFDVLRERAAEAPERWRRLLFPREGVDQKAFDAFITAEALRQKLLFEALDLGRPPPPVPPPDWLLNEEKENLHVEANRS